MLQGIYVKDKYEKSMFNIQNRIKKLEIYFKFSC